MTPSMMNSIDVIQTTDFTLATTIYCLGHDIIGMDKENPKRAVFYFSKTEETDRLVKEYFANNLLVNPLQFAQCQRELRAQLHTTI